MGSGLLTVNQTQTKHYSERLPYMWSQTNRPIFTPWNWSSDSSPPFPSLQPNDVHIWRSPLDLPADSLRQLQSYLSDDEQARAARFRFDHHRHHFIAGRGLLRVLLGQYVQQEPQVLRFEYGDRGKPKLANPGVDSQATSLQFNVSHSGGVALYAIALNRRVGIDLEELRPMPNAAQLAQRFFTEGEYAQLSAQPPEQQELAFFRGWTRKEAYLKATGEGLGGLETVEVSLLEEQPRVLEVMTSKENDGDKVNSTAQWYIYDIPLDTNHRAAVVFERPVDESYQGSMCFFEIV